MTRAKKRIGNVRTPYEREKNKQDFLKAYAACLIVTRACQIANINNNTPRYWLSTGFLTQAELDEAKAQYQDRIRGVLHDLGVMGVDRPLTDSHGRIIIDANGNPVLNNVKDTKILLEVAKHHLPEYQNSSYADSPVNIHINTAMVTNNSYFVGINLQGWQLEDVQKLKSVIEQAESRKLLPEKTQRSVIESSLES